MNTSHIIVKIKTDTIYMIAFIIVAILITAAFTVTSLYRDSSAMKQYDNKATQCQSIWNTAQTKYDYQDGYADFMIDCLHTR